MNRIETGRVVLRELGDHDVDAVTAAGNDPLIQQALPLPSPYTDADARMFILELAPAAWAAGGAEFAVADPDTGRLLGVVGVKPRVPGTAELGYWIAPWGRGQGAATAAVRAASEWAITNGYGRLELRIQPENGASQRVAVAAGYAREGLLHGGAVTRDGLRVDVTLWGRLAGDPPGPGLRLLPDLPGDELSDGTVTLRPVRADDLDDLYELRGLPDVIASQVPPERMSRDRLARWCARADSNWVAGNRAALTVRDAVTDVVAGEIALLYNEPSTGQAMIGYDLLPAWRGRGYASRAVRLLAGWAFERTGILRLIAGTAPTNAGSQRVLEAAGFRREGYQRSRLPGPGGHRIDDVLYALLPDELALTPTRTR